MNFRHRSLTLAILVQPILLLTLACPSPAQHAGGSAAAAERARLRAEEAAAKARAAYIRAYERTHHGHPPPPPLPPKRTVNLSSYGSDPTGKQDNSKALIAAMAAAGNGGTVNLGAGKFLCSTMITANNVNLVGAGLATTTFIPEHSTGNAIKLAGTASLSGFTITPAKVANGSSAQDSAIWVDGASGSITNLNITESSFGGVYLQNAKNFTLSNTTISNFSNSYGIEIIDCTNLTVDHVIVTPGGLYQVALNVASQATGCTGLTISNCVFNDQDPNLATNISGPLTNVGILNNAFHSTSLHIQPGSSTMNNLTISGNEITDGASSALEVANNPGSAPSKGITISNNTISPKIYSPFSNGWFQIGILVCAQNITVSGNSISGYSEGICVFACANATITGNSLNTIGTSAIYVGSSVTQAGSYDCTGYLTISNNKTSNCCVNNPPTAIMLISAPDNNPPKALAVSIVNNQDAGPANMANYYIDCLFPGAKVSGNTTKTTLANNIVP